MEIQGVDDSIAQIDLEIASLTEKSMSGQAEIFTNLKVAVEMCKRRAMRTRLGKSKRWRWCVRRGGRQDQKRVFDVYLPPASPVYSSDETRRRGAPSVCFALLRFLVLLAMSSAGTRRGCQRVRCASIMPTALKYVPEPKP